MDQPIGADFYANPAKPGCSATVLVIRLFVYRDACSLFAEGSNAQVTLKHRTPVLKLTPLVLTLFALSGFSGSVFAQDGAEAAGNTGDDMERVERGEYVARAAGCMSCHQEDLSG